ncbi:MAG: UvrD-helicase domain-containing protein [Desulfomicrobium escambiense]|nr:UvrD-helicase domain-containing protein [Desulfomicrobium escambiense]
MGDDDPIRHLRLARGDGRGLHLRTTSASSSRPPPTTCGPKYGDAPVAVVVGYDTRFLSDRYALEAAKILARNEIQVLLSDRDAPSQALAWQIIKRQCQGGINFTASFNPPRYNGLKFNAATGAPALPAVTDAIEEEVRRLMPGLLPPCRARAGRERLPHRSPGRLPGLPPGQDRFRGHARGRPQDRRRSPLRDQPRVPRRDPRGERRRGRGPPRLRRPLLRRGQPVLHRGEPGRAQGPRRPRPGATSAWPRTPTGTASASSTRRAGSSTPTSSWRCSSTTSSGSRAGAAASPARSPRPISSTASPARYDLPLTKTKVGFKYMAELFLQGQILFGGEESACIAVKDHLPEKDGIFAGLLVAEMIAATGRSLGDLARGPVQGVRGDDQRPAHAAPDPGAGQEAQGPRPGSAGEARAPQGRRRRDARRPQARFRSATAGSSSGQSGTEPLIRCYAEAENLRRGRGPPEEGAGGGPVKKKIVVLAVACRAPDHGRHRVLRQEGRDGPPPGPPDAGRPGRDGSGTSRPGRPGSRPRSSGSRPIPGPSRRRPGRSSGSPRPAKRSSSIPPRPSRSRCPGPPGLDDSRKSGPCSRASIPPSAGPSCTATGPLLIVAGAGTGKTKVITHRIARLIAAKAARPDEILALTFTEKAAGEMEARVDVLVPYTSSFAEISTFNSFGERVLRDYALDAGYRPDFRLLADVDQAIFFRENLFRLPLDYYRPLGQPTRHIQEVLEAIRRLKQEDVRPEDYVRYAEELAKRAAGESEKETARKHLEIARVFAAYQIAPADRGPDRFRGPGHARRRPPPAPPGRPRRAPAPLPLHPRRRVPGHELRPVRAPQDAGRRAPQPDRRRRRRPEHLPLPRRLPQQHPRVRGGLSRGGADRPDAELPLDPVHPRRLVPPHPAQRPEPARVQGQGRQAAQGGRRAAGASPSTCWTFDTLPHEADAVADRVLELRGRGAAWRDIAVLVRRNADADPYLRSFNIKQIPFRFSGSRGLYQQEEIKVVVAFIRALTDFENSRDLFYLALSDVYKAGPYDLSRIAGHADKKNLSLHDVFKAIAEGASPVEIAAETAETVKRIFADIRAFSELAGDAERRRRRLRLPRADGLPQVPGRADDPRSPRSGSRTSGSSSTRSGASRTWSRTIPSARSPAISTCSARSATIPPPRRRSSTRTRSTS